MTEQAPFTMLLTKEVDISTLSSSICEDISTVLEQANQLANGKRSKVLSKVNKGRTEETLRVGDVVVVHDHKKNKLASRIRDEPYTVKNLKSSKLVVLEDSYGKRRVRSRKHVRVANMPLEIL